MSQYSIGVDFGTLSARALLVDVSDGAELAQSEFVYPHAVMTDNDFCGVHLLKTDAFQHPQDYLDAFAYVVRDVTEKLANTFKATLEHNTKTLKEIAESQIIDVSYKDLDDDD